MSMRISSTTIPLPSISSACVRSLRMIRRTRCSSPPSVAWAIRRVTDMDLLTYSEDRRLLFRMAALSLAALVLVVALSLAMIVYVNHALADTYAGIVGTVAQKYPQAEAQVVQ